MTRKQGKWLLWKFYLLLNLLYPKVQFLQFIFQKFKKHPESQKLKLKYISSFDAFF